MKKILIVLLFISSYAYSQTEIRRNLSPAESSVTWQADYLIKKGHSGKFEGISGFIISKGTNFIKGDVVIDMNSLKDTDIKDPQGRKDLESHLKDVDFFEVSAYPKATFSIVSILSAPPVNGFNKYNVTGLLQIKDRTNLVTFAASIVQANNIVRVEGELVIDRTKWNVMYQAKSVVADLKNGFIGDEIRIGFDLVFK